MKDKVLVTIVTRNNKTLLLHLLDSIKKLDAGYEYDILLIDAESDEKEHLLCLDELSKTYRVQGVVDDRVETSYNTAWKENKDYKYYFFMHDDCCVHKEDWLKAFIDRMNSGYYEKEIETNPLRFLPVGRVAEGHQFWRGYDDIKGYLVQCRVLQPVLETLYPDKVLNIFKHSECDRVMYKNECLAATNGIRNLKEFADLQTQDKEKFDKLCNILNSHLTYFDEGSYPKEIYPTDQCWNKLTLVSEFLDSIDPLIHGWRSIGLYGDGYLEQMHGFATPTQYNYLVHYGGPNFIEFVAAQMKVPNTEVKKHFKNKVFLMSMDRLIKDYNKLKK